MFNIAAMLRTRPQRIMAGALLVLGCSKAPCPTDAAVHGDAAAMTDVPVIPVDAPGVAAFRACESDGRDGTGGFCDVTALWGIHVPVDLTPEAHHARGGVTVADFDGDGTLDMLVTQSPDVAPTLLFHRMGRWVDGTADWGLAGLRGTLASAAADFDGDGHQDLVIGFHDWLQPRLFRSDGTRFTEVPPPLGDNQEIGALVPADLDGDGRLDLLVAALSHPGSCPPSLVQGCPTGLQVYRQSSAWHFDPVPVPLSPRRVQTVRMIDLDGDGRDEVVFASDFGMLNGGNGVLRVTPSPGGGFTFTDITAATGFDQQVFAMGIGVLDVDGDGHDDVLVANFGRNVLFSNGRDRAAELGADVYGVNIPGVRPMYRSFDPDNAIEGPMGRFQDQYIVTSSMAMPTTKWCPVVFDADDDGIDDLYLAAGAIELSMFDELADQQGALLRGTGHRLVDVTVETHAGTPRNSNAAVAADLDGDGDLDLAVLRMATTGTSGGLTVLRNDLSSGHALAVVARGLGAARDGIGAMVTVQVGARTARKRLDGNLSVFCSGPHEARFGLGTSTMVDMVTVRFPSGATRQRANVPAGRVIIEE